MRIRVESVSMNLAYNASLNVFNIINTNIAEARYTWYSENWIFMYLLNCDCVLNFTIQLTQHMNSFDPSIACVSIIWVDIFSDKSNSSFRKAKHLYSEIIILISDIIVIMYKGICESYLIKQNWACTMKVSKRHQPDQKTKTSWKPPILYIFCMALFQ